MDQNRMIQNSIEGPIKDDKWFYLTILLLFIFAAMSFLNWTETRELKKLKKIKMEARKK